MSTSVSRKFALVALLAFAFFVCSVSAWGRDGHEITGAIADNFLSPKGKAFVDKILDSYQGPDGEDFDNLKELAPFADALRDTYDWAKNFHFINIPSDNEQFKPARDCLKDICLYGAINNYTSTLKKAAANKGIALMFLTHLIGDIHQPMHVSRKKDFGGNSLKLTLSDDWNSRYPETNLHKVWDTEMIIRFEKESRLRSSDAVAQNLIKTITPAYVAKYRRSMPVDQIAGETWALAKRAYESAAKLDMDDFATSYYDDNINVVKEQLKIGGLRLAGIINDIAEAPAAPASGAAASTPKAPASGAAAAPVPKAAVGNTAAKKPASLNDILADLEKRYKH